jgi:protein-disulfide isomerase
LGLLVWHPSRQASRKSAGFAEASERRPRKGRPRVQKVAAVETYQGTPVGFTADGHPFRGEPDAPLTLFEYTDYLCPFCERYFSQTMPGILSPI